MRIHFFVRTLDDKTGGGSHYNSIAYIRALRKAGHTVTVHVLYKVGSNFFPDDITPIVHEAFGLSFLKEKKYLTEVLKKYDNDADVFFLYAVEFLWAGGAYRRQGGKIPVVVYMDSYLPSMSCLPFESWKNKKYHYKRLPWDKTLGLRDGRYIDRFLPCSPAIGEEYIRFGFPKDRFTVLPNIVPDKSRTGETKENSDTVQLLYMGRLVYLKGVDLLIDALEGLMGLPWKLTIVGSGNMQENIEHRIAESRLPVTMHGWVAQDTVGTFYSKADVFVHPARWPDPAPRAIVDALWSGLPVVVPSEGGSAWLAGNAGVVFKKRDMLSLREALRSVITNASLRKHLATQARKEAHRFEESQVYPQLENILQTVIEETHA